MKIVDGVSIPLDEKDLAEIADREAKWNLQKAEAAKVEHLNRRKAEYPNVQELIVMLWDAMESGEIPRASAFYGAIKAVNDRYPNPR